MKIRGLSRTASLVMSAIATRQNSLETKTRKVVVGWVEDGGQFAGKTRVWLWKPGGTAVFLKSQQWAKDDGVAQWCGIG